MNTIHHQRMREALHLAQASLVRTSPNPRVGCVIYSEHGQKIAQGITSPPGGPHAEINALEQAYLQGISTENASVYVTLEPCSHTGRTGPCVEALIQAKVKGVYIGTSDPNPLVAGRGIKRLREAHIDVEDAILQEECRRYHAPFFKWITTGRPWVSLKGAMTLDGCLATATGHSAWITGIEARTHVHALRAQVDAMMVGGETARRDRPSLTVRHCEGTDPVAISLSRRLFLPNDAPFIRPGSIIFHSNLATTDRKKQLTDKGVKLIEVSLTEDGKGLNLSDILDELGMEGIAHLCVEGGGYLHGAFMSLELVDDLHLYIAPKLIGRGKPLFNFPSVNSMYEAHTLNEIYTETLGQDMYLYGRFTSKLEPSLS